MQVGDQLDRGDDEIEILSLLHRLQKQASAVGGAVHVLAGNHETMNARRNFRYATHGAMRRFNRWDFLCRHKGLFPGFLHGMYNCDLYTRRLACESDDQVCKDKLAAIPPVARSRFLALQSGGTLAKGLLAKERLAAVIVGDTIFVHGGISKDLISSSNSTRDLEHLNSELKSFFAGKKQRYKGEKALWNRDYSGRSSEQLAADPRACKELAETLERLPGRVHRMVVGHSVQKNGAITSACRGAVWRVDVGMSRGVRGSKPQVLEIRPEGRISILSVHNFLPASQESWASRAVGEMLKAFSDAWFLICRRE